MLHPASARPAAGQGGLLVDPFGRRITYLRLSITESCNLRCAYCRPANETGLASFPPSMRRAEIVRLASLFVSLGAEKVRLTGGEPTVHPDLVGIVEGVAALRPRPTLALTTNGVLLTRLAAPLRAAGLTRLNISLDAVSRERFRAMTGRDRFDAVRAGLDAAFAAGFARLKLNAVVLRGVNEDQIVPLALLARDLPVDVRFIEYMPMSGNAWNAGAQVRGEEIERLLSARFRLVPVAKEQNAGPALTFSVDGFIGRVGFVSPFSVPFCSDCNRVRVTARGALRLCLLGGGEADLVGPIRRGSTDAELEELVRNALAGKTERHPYASGASMAQPCGSPMWAVGG